MELRETMKGLGIAFSVFLQQRKQITYRRGKRIEFIEFQAEINKPASKFRRKISPVCKQPAGDKNCFPVPTDPRLLKNAISVEKFIEKV